MWNGKKTNVSGEQETAEWGHVKGFVQSKKFEFNLGKNERY